MTKEDIFQALNKLRVAFLAANNGEEVEEIIKGVLTADERMKIGRRIIVAQMLGEGEMSYDFMSRTLKVGKQTILEVQKLKEKYPKCFELINKRETKVEDEYHAKAYRMVGSSKRLQKFPEYTGFKRKDVKR